MVSAFDYSPQPGVQKTHLRELGVESMGVRAAHGDTLADLMLRHVRVGDVTLPPRFWYDIAPSEDGGPVIHLYIEIRQGQIEIRKIEIESSVDGRAIASRDVRGAARLDDHIEEAVSIVALPVVQDGHGYVATTIFPDPARGRIAARAVRQDARRKMTPERLAEVAEVYREAWPEAPTQAVADHLGKSPRAALDWINAARDAGHDLPPAKRGPKPERFRQEPED
jgi:hypothetical protein